MNILLLCGGDSSEHSVSITSSSFLKSELVHLPNLNVIEIIIHNGCWKTSNNHDCYLKMDGYLVLDDNSSYKIDYLVPCFHGYPGETGDIQSLCEMINIPYLGCDSESSKLCYNKISTKLWLSELNIPNTPFISIYDQSPDSTNLAINALKKWGELFIKAASQGSSIGCYRVNDLSTLFKAIEKAFKYSNRVIIEQSLKHRELEVAVYEYKNDIIVTNPGEIIFPENSFYTYDEKYNQNSSTLVKVVADYLTDNQLKLLREYSLRVFKGLKLKDLSRIDFFLSYDNKIYVNEINTFPGMTQSSLFPKLLANSGTSMRMFLLDRIQKAL